VASQDSGEARGSDGAQGGGGSQGNGGAAGSPSVSGVCRDATVLTGADKVLPVSYWEQQMLTRTWDTDPNKCFAMSLAPDSGGGRGLNLYHLNGCIDGYTAMYEATGKTQFIDRAIKLTENVIGVAKLDGDGFFDWTFKIALDETHGWRGTTRMLRVLHDTPALYGNAGYKAKHDTILRWTEKNIFQKWYQRAKDRNAWTSIFYRSRTHIVSHWAMITRVLSKQTADGVWRPIYEEMYKKMDGDMSPYISSSLHEMMVTHPGHRDVIVFNDQWSMPYKVASQCTESPCVSDTHHGMDTIGYIAFAREESNDWSTSDVRGLAALMRRLTWNGNATTPMFSFYLDGTGTWAENECIEEGYAKLGKWDPALQRVLEKDDPRGCNHPQFFGHMALSARCLNGE